jgi:hypothetical protein
MTESESIVTQKLSKMKFSAHYSFSTLDKTNEYFVIVKSISNLQRKYYQFDPNTTTIAEFRKVLEEWCSTGPFKLAYEDTDKKAILVLKDYEKTFVEYNVKSGSAIHILL